MQLKAGAYMPPPPIAGNPSTASALQMKPLQASHIPAVHRQPGPRIIQKMDKEEARLDKWCASRDDNGFVGGSYKSTKDISCQGVRESDHTPPKSTYAGTYYNGISEDNMPAVSMPWIVHRQGQSGMGGGVSTTGSQAYIVSYRSGIAEHMKKKEFYKAFIMAAIDQQNALGSLLSSLKSAKVDVSLLAKLVTTLIPAQLDALNYAEKLGLVTDVQKSAVLIEIDRQQWLDYMLKA